MGDEIMVRRIGYDVVHVADVPPSLLWDGTKFGAVATYVDGPIAARCKVTLRGEIVKMRDDQKVSCRTCAALTTESPDDPR